jgi:hypothetical protein
MVLPTSTEMLRCGIVPKSSMKTRPDRIIKIDMAAKRHKKHKNQISGLVILMGYETEIREI